MPAWSLRAAVAAFLLTPVLPSLAQEKAFPKFEEKVIDPHAGEVVYAVTQADVDGDGKADVVAVTEDAVYWYAAPDWKKHTIVKGQTTRDNVCIEPHDIDGDGKIDFALGAGWPDKGGTIQWLSRNESLDEKWNVHFIDEIPSTHRMRFADVLGTGKAQLVVSPLNKSDGDGARLTAYEVPANPKTDRWPPIVMDDSFNRMHNHWHTSPRGEGRAAFTLTASQEGIHLVLGQPRTREATRNDDVQVLGQFRKIQISAGAAGEKPTEKGAGEVKSGRLKNRLPIIATVEPMHGNMAVVYVREGRDPVTWRRTVLDDTLGRGHAVWLADFNGDGNDEIVVGHSLPATGEIKGPGVFVYQAQDDTGTKWTKHVIDDGGMATEDAFAADMTGDGRPDIVAGGRNTHNVKLYVNVGP